jgi:polyisoprenoid-binding protein YceI
MKLTKSAFLFLALATTIIACGPKGKTVETSEAKEVAASKDAKSFALNVDKSQVTWIGSKPAGKHNGTINITGGTLKMNGNEIAAGNFTMDINSLKDLDMAGSDNAGKLEGHLKSADFFDAANFPEANFEITNISAFSNAELVADNAEFETENTPSTQSEILVNDPTHFISGNLTMRGTTKNITFPANVKVANGLINAQANFNINRTDWGLMYGDEAGAADKAKDQFIYNTVTVGIVIEASTQAAAGL